MQCSFLNFLTPEMKQDNQIGERRSSDIAKDLFDCKPCKVCDTVLHHLHPPAVSVGSCSATIFAAACEQRTGLQRGGRMGGGGSMGHFVTDRKCSLLSHDKGLVAISACHTCYI